LHIDADARAFALEASVHDSVHALLASGGHGVMIGISVAASCACRAHDQLAQMPEPCNQGIAHSQAKMLALARPDLLKGQHHD
jgi:hypothetical protein